MIDHKQYIKDATRTESVPESIVLERNYLIGALKMTVASAQILDLLKKKAFYRNKPLEGEALIEQEAADAKILGQACNLADDGIGMIELQYHKPVAKEDLNLDVRLFHAIVGLSTETAEIIEALLGLVDQDEPIDRVNILEELGDLNWYQAIAIDALGGNLGSILDTNINKLKKRYPDKFTDSAANNRDLFSEREVLEEGAQ